VASEEIAESAARAAGVVEEVLEVEQKGRKGNKN